MELTYPLFVLSNNRINSYIVCTLYRTYIPLFLKKAGGVFHSKGSITVKRWKIIVQSF